MEGETVDHDYEWAQYSDGTCEQTYCVTEGETVDHDYESAQYSDGACE